MERGRGASWREACRFQVQKLARQETEKAMVVMPSLKGAREEPAAQLPTSCLEEAHVLDERFKHHHFGVDLETSGMVLPML